MNIEDEYYFFILRALTNVDENKQYLYEMENNILFSVIVNNNIKKPSLRNEQINDEYTKAQIEKLIDLIPNNKSIIEIPKLTFFEKKMFLEKFINQCDGKIKEILNNELCKFSNTTDFSNVFIGQLKYYDKKLAYDYHMQIGQFFKFKEIEKLTPIGITEKSLVLW